MSWNVCLTQHLSMFIERCPPPWQDFTRSTTFDNSFPLPIPLDTINGGWGKQKTKTPSAAWSPNQLTPDLFQTQLLCSQIRAIFPTSTHLKVCNLACLGPIRFPRLNKIQHMANRQLQVLVNVFLGTITGTYNFIFVPAANSKT